MIELTDKEINKLIKSNFIVVIDCWAPWCTPCLYYSPIIEDLSLKYFNIKKIVFAKINLEANRETAKQFQIMAVPTLLIFKNGKLVEKVVGIVPTRKLEPIIMEYIEEKKSGKKK